MPRACPDIAPLLRTCLQWIRAQELNQPHNLLLTDGGRRAFLFPQRFAEAQALGLVPPPLAETGVNPVGQRGES